MKLLKNLTADEKAHHDSLSTDDEKKQYLEGLEPKKEEVETSSSAPKVDIIDNILDQNPAEVEEEEEKRKKAALHQKRQVKKKTTPKPKEEEKSTLETVGRVVGVVAVVYGLYKWATSTKGSKSHETITTESETEVQNSTTELNTSQNTVQNAGFSLGDLNG